jgi:hypothetical protein
MALADARAGKYSESDWESERASVARHQTPFPVKYIVYMAYLVTRRGVWATHDRWPELGSKAVSLLSCYPKIQLVYCSMAVLGHSMYVCKQTLLLNITAGCLD